MDETEVEGWVVTNEAGTILARFPSEQEAHEALLTGDYSDTAEVAYVN